jgi:hypothetical protein
MNQTFKVKHLCVFVVAASFLLYQLFLLQNSFPAIIRIYTTVAANTNFWTLVWLSSELAGEIGLIIRVAGACLFVFIAWKLVIKREFSVFRKAVLLEGIHYLFYIPFILNLFSSPLGTESSQAVYYETAISYTVQTALVSSSFITLYVKTRNQTIQSQQTLRWSAVAAVCFVFSLWFKHFMFNLYALPIDFTNPVLVVGLVNSTLTMLVAALTLLATLAPVIRTKTTTLNHKQIGFSLLLIGTYFIIYILIAQVNDAYMAFLQLTELWAITFVVAGVCFLTKNTEKTR